MKKQAKRRSNKYAVLEKKSNEEILRTSSSKRKIMCIVKKRHFTGHVMKKRTNLEHPEALGTFTGKESGIKILDGSAA